jgi:hypothetical protein
MRIWRFKLSALVLAALFVGAQAQIVPDANFPSNVRVPDIPDNHWIFEDHARLKKDGLAGDLNMRNRPPSSDEVGVAVAKATLKFLETMDSKHQNEVDFSARSKLAYQDALVLTRLILTFPTTKPIRALPSDTLPKLWSLVPYFDIQTLPDPVLAIKMDLNDTGLIDSRSTASTDPSLFVSEIAEGMDQLDLIANVISDSSDFEKALADNHLGYSDKSMQWLVDRRLSSLSVKALLEIAATQGYGPGVQESLSRLTKIISNFDKFFLKHGLVMSRPFPDIPPNNWAYEAIARLHGYLPSYGLQRGWFNNTTDEIAWDAHIASYPLRRTLAVYTAAACQSFYTGSSSAELVNQIPGEQDRVRQLLILEKSFGDEPVLSKGWYGILNDSDLIAKYDGLRRFAATKPFKDVKRDHWAALEIQELKAAKLMVGYLDGKFGG